MFFYRLKLIPDEKIVDHKILFFFYSSSNRGKKGLLSQKCYEFLFYENFSLQALDDDGSMM